MDPIHININVTIPDLSLFIGFGLLVFAITTFLAISNHWDWLRNRPNPLPWMAEHYVGFLLPLGFVAIALAVYFWIWDIRGEIGQIVALLDGEKDPQNIRNLAYAIGALLAAVALAATIPFQLIKVWVNERLAKTTEQGLLIDRVTRAIDQLGSNEESVQIGGIMSLKKIAQDSHRYHVSIMEILCTFIRTKSPAECAKIIEEDNELIDLHDVKHNLSNEIPDPTNTVQAAISVIARRTPERVYFERDLRRNGLKRPYSLDLRNTNLQRINLWEADLSNAMLINSKFHGASLGNANLTFADLRAASFYSTNFVGANLKLCIVKGVNLCGNRNLTQNQLQLGCEPKLTY